MKLTFNHNNIFQSHILFLLHLHLFTSKKPVPCVLLPTSTLLSFFFVQVREFHSKFLSLSMHTPHVIIIEEVHSWRDYNDNLLLLTLESNSHSLTHILQMTFQMPLNIFCRCRSYLSLSFVCAQFNKYRQGKVKE
jgi:hypothetical protein